MPRMTAAWWWVDRWRKSTAYTDMNAEEQGVYRNLLDEVWLREDHIIPDDDMVLMKVSGDPTAWPRVRAKVLRWMTKTKGGWTHETALEVIGQSQRRADKQQRYRDKWRNADGNAAGNDLGNARGNKAGNNPGSPSPSPSPTTEVTNERVAATPADRPAVRTNPLTGPRDPREREFLALVREAAELTGLDPIDIASQATHYEGAKGRRINPATMSDDRLLNSISDLRELVKAERAKRGTAATPPEAVTESGKSSDGSSVRPAGAPRQKPATGSGAPLPSVSPAAQPGADGGASEAWEAVRAQLTRSVPARAMETIFGPTEAVELVAEGSGRTLVIQAPARSVLWVQSSHAEELNAALEAAGLEDVVVEFRPVAARAPGEAG